MAPKSPSAVAAAADPHFWLEDVLGQKQLAWVEQKNKECIDAVGDPKETDSYKRIKDILDSKVRDGEREFDFLLYRDSRIHHDILLNSLFIFHLYKYYRTKYPMPIALAMMKTPSITTFGKMPTTCRVSQFLLLSLRIVQLLYMRILSNYCT